MAQGFFWPSLVEIGQDMSKLYVLEVLPEEERRKTRRIQDPAGDSGRQGKNRDVSKIQSQKVKGAQAWQVVEITAYQGRVKQQE